MIVFDLQCSRGHMFEGWFDNLKSFEEQNAKNMINCPHCNDTNIKKILSPVAMKSSSEPGAEKDVSRIDYRKLAKELLDYIHKEFDDLGADFAKEALKIHYGVSEERNIRGTATQVEEDLLKQEGVQFLKIPIIKKDDDKKN
ncbi:MAG TPA: DUF1178 family protein [Desulfatiglandales bacterium]|nr:DUF1178 family protein [Desulfatiglandales bacterium]